MRSSLHNNPGSWFGNYRSKIGPFASCSMTTIPNSATLLMLSFRLKAFGSSTHLSMLPTPMLSLNVGFALSEKSAWIIFWFWALTIWSVCWSNSRTTTTHLAPIKVLISKLLSPNCFHLVGSFIEERSSVVSSTITIVLPLQLLSRAHNTLSPLYFLLSNLPENASVFRFSLCFPIFPAKNLDLFNWFEDERWVGSSDFLPVFFGWGFYRVRDFFCSGQVT